MTAPISAARITVLVAAYQGEAYLREQLDSILNQTVQGLRVLVSDDGSTDGTWDIIEEYMHRHPGQVEGLRHEKTEGGNLHPAAAHFFWLLSRAEGDYVLLSDQDDVWKKEKAACLLAAMEQAEAEHGAEMPVLAYSDALVVDRDLKEIAPSFFAYQHIGCGRTKLSQILAENPVTGGALMMNRQLLRYLKQTPKACVMHDWWIALTAACFGKIVCVKEPLYLYRQHGTNTLGARETGSIKDIRRRLAQGEQVKENYRQMFSQASCFLEQFGSQIPERETETLQAYLSLPCQTPLGRLRTICRCGFYKSSRLQTLAQCLTMPGR